MCHPAWCSGSRSIPAWCIGEAEDVRPGPEGGCGVTNFSRFGALVQMERYLTRKWRLNFGIYWIRQHNQFIAMIVLQLFPLWYYFCTWHCIPEVGICPKTVALHGISRCPFKDRWFRLVVNDRVSGRLWRSWNGKKVFFPTTIRIVLWSRVMLLTSTDHDVNVTL